MVARVIQVATDSEIGQLLDEIGDSTLILVRDGEHFVVRRGSTIRDDDQRYRQERFLELLSDVAGAWSDIDTEKLKRDIRAQRGQDSIGRPAQ
ncbi:MAG: hypothetical protein ACRDJH_03495 [Thermomicrobiales bacterium]